MNCTTSTSYNISLGSCPSNIIVRAGLPGNKEIMWAIKDKFDITTSGIDQTSASGVLTIPTVAFKPGKFNQHAGAFLLNLYDLDQQPVLFTIKGKQYETVVISFEQMLDVSMNPHNVIQ